MRKVNIMINDWKIVKKLNSIAKDKWVHFCVCMIMTLAFSAIGSLLGLGLVSVAIAAVATIAIGFVKELSDKKSGSGFDKQDIVADFLGCLVAAIPAVLMLI